MAVAEQMLDMITISPVVTQCDSFFSVAAAGLAGREAARPKMVSMVSFHAANGDVAGAHGKHIHRGFPRAKAEHGGSPRSWEAEGSLCNLVAESHI